MHIYINILECSLMLCQHNILKLRGYFDSDLGSSIDLDGAIRNITWYCFNFNKISGVLSWKSRRKPSTVNLKQLLKDTDLQLTNKTPIVVYEDNQ